MDENKQPRPRRRGGRARAQNTGGILANLHGINVVVDEMNGSAGVGKKSTASRLKKEGGVVVVPMPDPEEEEAAAAKKKKKPMPLMKVSKPTLNQENDKLASKKTVVPPRLDKENTVNIYTSPDAAEERMSSPLSPVETASPTPPCSSVKVNSTRDFVEDDARRILFSPLSSTSSASSDDESVQSNINNRDHRDGSNGDSKSGHSDIEDEDENDSQSNDSADDDDAGSRSDSSEDSNLNAETSDVDDMSHQHGYDDDDDDDDDDVDNNILSQYDESEDEDYSIDEDSSNSDDELEFEEEECESEKKQRNKGKKSVIDKCTRIEGRVEDDVNDGNDAVVEHCDDESQTSFTNQLAECKVNLGDILDTEGGDDDDDDDNDGTDWQVADDCGEEEDVVDPIGEDATLDEDTERCMASPTSLERSFAPESMATESNQTPPPPAPPHPTTSEIYEMATESNQTLPPAPQSPPSTSEIYEIVDRLFHEADKDTVTVRIIVQKVATHFNLPTVEKSTKTMIKRRLTDLIQGNCESVHFPRCDEVGSENTVPDADDISKVEEEVEIHQSMGSNDAIHDFGDDEDEHNVNVAVEKDLPISPSVPLSQHIDEKHTALPESNVSTVVSDDLLPSVDEPGINEALVGEVDGSELFQNLSLDGSGKSSRATEQHDAPATEIVHTGMPERIVQQDLSISAAASDNLQQNAHPFTASTELKMELSAGHYMPSVHELTFGDELEGDGNDDSILFQNLSPDISVKSRSAPGNYHSSTKYKDTMSLSDSFRNLSKSRSVVEKGKWSLGSQIGAGSFGRVYTGMNAVNGSEFSGGIDYDVSTLHFPHSILLLSVCRHHGCQGSPNTERKQTRNCR